MNLLTLTDLQVAVQDKPIVKGVRLRVDEGEIHAIMGPNGSGKSTLVNALAGHPAYSVTGGSAEFAGKDLKALAAEDRARAGLFLAFQYPRDIAGVTLRSFLYAAYKAQMEARHPEEKVLSPFKFQHFLVEKMQALHMDPSFAERFLNHGFSGGEKKKAEILQMHILRPRLALLDETDSGLDVDALKIVSEGVNALRTPQFGAIIVTHYARILEYIKPNHVHVMFQGKIVQSGGADLALELEREGYRKWL